jgi:signal peptidase I
MRMNVVLLAVILALTSCKLYQQPSSSMEPTLLAGDYFLATSSTGAPRRREIVVYRQNGEVFAKRVVGLPGDTLGMSNAILVVNGDSQPEAYARHYGEEPVTNAAFSWQARFLPHVADRSRYHPTLTSWGPIVVPPDKYFVLGDNRGQSTDSRYNGFVDRTSIFARPQFIYFSKSRATGDIRWNRIGRSIRDSL